MNDTVVVVTGAEPLDPTVVAELPSARIVIAADGALDHALAAGLTPAALVGDLDSVSDDGLAWATGHASIERHPADKDRTDTELALAVAVELDPARLVLVSGGGDRLDHVLAALGALGHPSLTSIPTIDAWWGVQRLRVVHGPGRTTLDLPTGTTLSLLATHGPCTGVGITGVRWPLQATALAPLVGLGVSNVTDGDPIELTVSTGVLTVVIDPPAEPTSRPAADPSSRPSTEDPS